jgi:WD40 repeat protein
MRLAFQRSCAPVCLLLCLLAGCQPVREDRSINWSGDGKSVSFQHGDEGVFLADKETGKLTKIFQPGADVIATGSPLWSPSGKRVLFTTASSVVKGQPAAILPFWDTTSDPAGNVYAQQEIVYTCYLHEETPGQPQIEPTKLFGASCDHVGYVAANLAVRWHPKGDRVLFVQRDKNRKHGLYEFDLVTKKTRPVFPHTADALIFDWSPDGSQLACLLADNPSGKNDGIWIGQPDGEWWQVPQSAQFAVPELPSTLEQLRATRPAWTGDGKRFAFPAWVAGPTAKAPGRCFLRIATRDGHKVETLAEGPEPYHDLHWDSDGARLGVVRGSEKATLHIVSNGGELSEAVNRQPVRQFVGWNTTGKRLAYLAPDGEPAAGSEWALLFVPDEHGRDAVFVADGDGSEAGRAVFTGMRVTFPQWSPKEDKLSLWFTFTPTYHSALSLLLGGGLRRGDPAALFDPASGKISWLATSSQEKAQVGHYYLLKRDYTTAWKWYEDAMKDWPAAQSTKLDASTLFTPDGVRRFSEPQDIRFFEYHCLTKLGRRDEAKAKLAAFRKAFPPTLEPDPKPNPNNGDAPLRQAFAPDGLLALLLRDFYCAEVFLSLDAISDAETYFRDEMKMATTDTARLSSATVLGQILLLQNKRQEYAELTTGTFAPVLMKLTKDRDPAAPSDPPELAFVTEFGGPFALMPLFAPSFLKGIPEKDVRALIEPWEGLRAKANTSASRGWCDQVLWAVYDRVGMEKERQEVVKRLGSDPGGESQNVEKGIKEFRATLKLLKPLAQRR